MEKKKLIIFTICVIAFYFVLDIFLQAPKTTKPPPKNTNIKMVSTPVSMNTKESDYVNKNEPTAQIQKKNSPHPENITDNQTQTDNELIDYSPYLGSWIYGAGGKSVDEVNEKGGIVFNFISFDLESQIATGSIKTVQKSKPPIITFIEFQNRIKDGVVYFDFIDDGLGNTGNGIITFSNGVVKISLSTTFNPEDDNKYLFKNGLFQLIKAE